MQITHTRPMRTASEAVARFLACIMERIPRLLLIQHSLYVGVVENISSPTTHKGAVQKDGAEIP